MATAIGDLVINFGGNTRRFDSAAKRVRSSVGDVARAARRMGAEIQRASVPLVAAGGAITGIFAKATLHFAEVGDELDKMSQRTGMASPALAALGFAAEQSQASLDNVEKALKRQSKVIRDMERGLSTAVEAFDALGISFEQISNLSPEGQFDLVAKRLNEIENPTRRAALAQEVWGRAGTMLIPMLDNLEALKAEAKELGIIPTEEEVKNAAKVTDAINRVKRTVGAAFFNIGAAISGPVLKGLDAVKRIASATANWIRENKKLVKIVAAVGVGLLAVGGALFAIGTAAVAAGVVLSGVASVIGTIAAIGPAIPALLAIAGVTAAVVAGVVAWTKYTESGQQALGYIRTGLARLGDIAKDTFGGIKDAIMAGDLKLAGQIAITGLKVVLLEGLNGLVSAFNGQFGDFIGSIGSQIIAGDFSGAWNIAVSQMAVVWDTFSAGVVMTFSGAIKQVIDYWESAVKKISTGILDLTSSESTLGKIIRAYGKFVDPLGVVGLDEMMPDIAAIQKERDRLNQELGLGRENVRGEAIGAIGQNVAATGIGRTADAIRKYLDGLERTAQARVDEAMERARAATGGGRERANEALERAKQELEALRALAQSAAASAAAGAGAGGDDTGFDGSGPPQSNVSRYAAAMAKGSAEAYSTILKAGSTVEDKQLKTQKDIAKSTAATAKGMAELKATTFAIPTA